MFHDGRMKRFQCLSLALILSLLAGCSDTPETTTSTFALTSPARLASVDDSTLLVSDYTAEFLHLVDMTTLEPVRSIRVKGQPTGALYFEQRYYFANKSTRSIDVLDSNGTFLYHLGQSTGLFRQVNDLALNETDRILYAVDIKAGLIKRFDLDSPGDSPTEIAKDALHQPSALTYDHVGQKLYVSDFGDANHIDPVSGLTVPVPPTIHILDADGNKLDEIVAQLVGGWSGKKQTFSAPQGLYVAASGQLFVTDASSGEVQMYDLTDPLKPLVKTLGITGTGVGELFYPLDVYIDEDSMDVYVTDNKNGRVSLFQEGGLLP